MECDNQIGGRAILDNNGVRPPVGFVYASASDTGTKFNDFRLYETPRTEPATRLVRSANADTDYADYRPAGFDIDSGKMEATCKPLVSVRLKGSGRPWSEGGTVAMVARIAHRINGTRDEFWATRPLQRAT